MRSSLFVFVLMKKFKFETYIFEGAVSDSFGKCIAHKWKGETMAISEKRARSNLMYQFKKQNNMTASAKINLHGKIILKERV